MFTNFQPMTTKSPIQTFRQRLRFTVSRPVTGGNSKRTQQLLCNQRKSQKRTLETPRFTLFPRLFALLANHSQTTANQEPCAANHAPGILTFKTGMPYQTNAPLAGYVSRTLTSLMRVIETFCARLRAPSAILTVMLVPLSGLDTHAKISLDVFLRLTAMDVCCGPPAST